MYDVSVWNIVVHGGSEKKGGTSSSAKKANRGQFRTDVDAPRTRRTVSPWRSMKRRGDQDRQWRPSMTPARGQYTALPPAYFSALYRCGVAR
jgi:hypothetical protein